MFAFLKNLFRPKAQPAPVETVANINTQKGRLLNYLRAGGEVDKETARSKLGVEHLGSHVRHLRVEGHNIITVPVKTRPGRGRPNARYRLAS